VDPAVLDGYFARPRPSGLAVSPDGRLVTTVSLLSADGTAYQGAIFEIDPAGSRPPRRLTWSAEGETAAGFQSDGSLLFVSSRPVGRHRRLPAGVPLDAEEPEDAKVKTLWRLPAEGGEASPVASWPSGVEPVVATARNAAVIAYAVSTFPGIDDPRADARRGEERERAKVTALLFEDEDVIRHWDHYLGPRRRRIVVGDAAPDAPRRLVGLEADGALDEAGFDLTPDGETLVTEWWVSAGWLARRSEIRAIDRRSGQARTLVSDPGANLHGPRCAPDGRRVAYLRQAHGDSTTLGSLEIWVADLDGASPPQPVTAGVDLRPSELVWLPDTTGLLFVAEENGRAPVFRVDLDGGTPVRLSADGAFDSLAVSPDGTHVFALRSTPAEPPVVVRIATTGEDQVPLRLPTPGDDAVWSGRLEEVVAHSADGTALQAWLVLPPEATATTPVPLAVFIHGGPYSSTHAWSWRWNPQLLAADGYAVLLPNPALSTGFGQRFADRGRGVWGPVVAGDLEALEEAAVARPEIDGSRRAALGGSFGGYMANWLAGHCDRYRCIVTHASLWDLEQFGPTTDHPDYWEREFGDPQENLARYRAASPSAAAAAIRTPMLVIHGEQDLRVPISEALRLWSDLRRRGLPARFLYFPDENHWVLKPPNSRIWYQTVGAFLATYLRDAPFTRPALL